MRKFFLTAFSLTLAAFAQPVAGQMAPTMAASKAVEIEATVVDLSCKLVYDLGGDMHRECAQVCADRGISLGLVTADGTFYLPVSMAMPGAGSNEMLRPHAEHKVKVKGKVIQRAGMNSIIIESVGM